MQLSDWVQRCNYYEVGMLNDFYYGFLSRVTMQCMQSVILFYQFCLSGCLSVCPMQILHQNEWTYCHTCLTF